jgi:UDP-N-acetylmuramoyl-L-alanyl-D-glutamate--2,6-diaminopimelate ligase
MISRLKRTAKKIMPVFIIDWYHFCLALSGAVYYGFPASKLKVIGVTGTNGKSSTVELASKIMEEAGFPIASLSSIQFRIKDKIEPNALKMTMPGRWTIQSFFDRAAAAGCNLAFLEVTSEGIKQHRHRFIEFDTAVFTNITPEHIEAHGNFENYKLAKGKLFAAVKFRHIVNLDDPNAGYFLSFPSKETYGYGLKGEKRKNTDVKKDLKIVEAENIKVGFNNIGFRVKGVDFSIGLGGGFNVYNALAAICVGLSQGVSLQTCQAALAKVTGLAGRMEEAANNPFRVVVDYAFTPNALEKVYATLKGQVSPKGGKLICLLGACGGGRDKWKRPVLGNIANKYCDEIIIANEDPYDEDPQEIIDQVAKGAGGRAQKILDRREAIRRALGLAKPGDIVVMTGKGCEPWICLKNGEKTAWNERMVAIEELEKLGITPGKKS